MPHKAAFRFIALLTSFMFLTTNAGALPPAPVSGNSTVLSKLELNPKQVTLDSKLGKIEEVYQSSAASPVVVLIQDAHAIPEAQRNIQKIIEHFQKTYGIGLVGLEGAASQADPQILKSFPEKETLRKVADEYFAQGELTGVNAAAIFNDTNGIYHGIEDWKLYEEALGFYLLALEQEPKLIEQLSVSKKELEEKKKKAYSKELLEVDQALVTFQDNQSDLISVLKTLAQIKRLAPGSELATLLEEIERDDQDQALVEIQVKKIAEQVVKYLKSQPASSENNKHLLSFNQKRQEFQTSHISAPAFALFLHELASSVCHSERSEGSQIVDSSACGLRMTQNLSRLIANQKKMRDIEGTRFFHDFEQYAQSVKESLFKSGDDKNLDHETRKLELLGRLIRLELSRDDWKEMKDLIVPSLRNNSSCHSERSEESRDPSASPLNPTDSRTEQSRNRLGFGAASPQDDTACQNALSGFLAMTDDLLKPHLAFYHNAEQRDEVFTGQLLSLMKSKKLNSALLVAGGFHTEGLVQRLKEKKISYVLLTPHIGSIPDEIHYRDHMKGQVSWKDYFEIENGKVNLHKAFVRATRDKLLKQSGEDSGRLLKYWRDQIIRDLAEKGELTKAGNYTIFIDEVLQKDPKQKQDDPLKRVDRFIDGLRDLQARGELTEQNILKILRPSTVAAASPSGALTSDPLDTVIELPGFGSFSIMQRESGLKVAARSTAQKSNKSNEGVSGEKKIIGEDVSDAAGPTNQGEQPRLSPDQKMLKPDIPSLNNPLAIDQQDQNVKTYKEYTPQNEKRQNESFGIKQVPGQEGSGVYGDQARQNFPGIFPLLGGQLEHEGGSILNIQESQLKDAELSTINSTRAEVRSEKGVKVGELKVGDTVVFGIGIDTRISMQLIRRRNNLGLHDRGSDHFYPLEEGRNTVGRAKNNSIVLPPLFISGYHAILERSGDTITVYDLNSTNGTLIQPAVEVTRADLERELKTLRQWAHKLSQIHDPQENKQISLKAYQLVKDIMENRYTGLRHKVELHLRKDFKVGDLVIVSKKDQTETTYYLVTDESSSGVMLTMREMGNKRTDNQVTYDSNHFDHWKENYQFYKVTLRRAEVRKVLERKISGENDSDDLKGATRSQLWKELLMLLIFPSYSAPSFWFGYNMTAIRTKPSIAPTKLIFQLLEKSPNSLVANPAVPINWANVIADLAINRLFAMPISGILILMSQSPITLGQVIIIMLYSQYKNDELLNIKQALPARAEVPPAPTEPGTPQSLNRSDSRAEVRQGELSTRVDLAEEQNRKLERIHSGYQLIQTYFNKIGGVQNASTGNLKRTQEQLERTNQTIQKILNGQPQSPNHFSHSLRKLLADVSAEIKRRPGGRAEVRKGAEATKSLAEILDSRELPRFNAVSVVGKSLAPEPLTFELSRRGISKLILGGIFFAGVQGIAADKSKSKKQERSDQSPKVFTRNQQEAWKKLLKEESVDSDDDLRTAFGQSPDLIRPILIRNFAELLPKVFDRPNRRELYHTAAGAISEDFQAQFSSLADYLGNPDPKAFPKAIRVLDRMNEKYFAPVGVLIEHQRILNRWTPYVHKVNDVSDVERFKIGAHGFLILYGEDGRKEEVGRAGFRPGKVKIAFIDKIRNFQNALAYHEKINEEGLEFPKNNRGRFLTVIHKLLTQEFLGLKVDQIAEKTKHATFMNELQHMFEIALEVPQDEDYEMRSNLHELAEGTSPFYDLAVIASMVLNGGEYGLQAAKTLDAMYEGAKRKKLIVPAKDEIQGYISTRLLKAKDDAAFDEEVLPLLTKRLEAFGAIDQKKKAELVTIAKEIFERRFPKVPLAFIKMKEEKNLQIERVFEKTLLNMIIKHLRETKGTELSRVGYWRPYFINQIFLEGDIREKFISPALKKAEEEFPGRPDQIKKRTVELLEEKLRSGIRRAETRSQTMLLQDAEIFIANFQVALTQQTKDLTGSDRSNKRRSFFDQLHEAQKIRLMSLKVGDIVEERLADGTIDSYWAVLSNEAVGTTIQGIYWVSVEKIGKGWQRISTATYSPYKDILHIMGGTSDYPHLAKIFRASSNQEVTKPEKPKELAAIVRRLASFPGVIDEIRNVRSWNDLTIPTYNAIADPLGGFGVDAFLDKNKDILLTELSVAQAKKPTRAETRNDSQARMNELFEFRRKLAESNLEDVPGFLTSASQLLENVENPNEAQYAISTLNHLAGFLRSRDHPGDLDQAVQATQISYRFFEKYKTESEVHKEAFYIVKDSTYLVRYLIKRGTDTDIKNATETLQRTRQLLRNYASNDSALLKQIMWMIVRHLELAAAFIRRNKSTDLDRAADSLKVARELLIEYGDDDSNVRKESVYVVGHYFILANTLMKTKGSRNLALGKEFIDSARELFEQYENEPGMADEAPFVLGGYNQFIAGGKAEDLEVMSDAVITARSFFERYKSLPSMRSEASYMIANYNQLARTLIRTGQPSNLDRAEKAMTESLSLLDRYSSGKPQTHREARPVLISYFQLTQAFLIRGRTQKSELLFKIASAIMSQYGLTDERIQDDFVRLQAQILERSAPREVTPVIQLAATTVVPIVRNNDASKNEAPLAPKPIIPTSKVVTSDIVKDDLLGIRAKMGQRAAKLGKKLSKTKTPEDIDAFLGDHKNEIASLQNLDEKYRGSSVLDFLRVLAEKSQASSKVKLNAEPSKGQNKKVQLLQGIGGKDAQKENKNPKKADEKQDRTIDQRIGRLKELLADNNSSPSDVRREYDIVLPKLNKRGNNIKDDHRRIIVQAAKYLNVESLQSLVRAETRQENLSTQVDLAEKQNMKLGRISKGYRLVERFVRARGVQRVSMEDLERIERQLKRTNRTIQKILNGRPQSPDHFSHSLARLLEEVSAEIQGRKNSRAEVRISEMEEVRRDMIEILNSMKVEAMTAEEKHNLLEAIQTAGFWKEQFRGSQEMGVRAYDVMELAKQRADERYSKTLYPLQRLEDLIRALRVIDLRVVPSRAETRLAPIEPSTALPSNRLGSLDETQELKQPLEISASVARWQEAKFRIALVLEDENAPIALQEAVGELARRLNERPSDFERVTNEVKETVAILRDAAVIYSPMQTLAKGVNSELIAFISELINPKEGGVSLSFKVPIEDGKIDERTLLPSLELLSDILLQNGESRDSRILFTGANRLNGKMTQPMHDAHINYTSIKPNRLSETTLSNGQLVLPYLQFDPTTPEVDLKRVRPFALLLHHGIEEETQKLARLLHLLRAVAEGKASNPEELRQIFNRLASRVSLLKDNPNLFFNVSPDGKVNIVDDSHVAALLKLAVMEAKARTETLKAA